MTNKFKTWHCGKLIEVEIGQKFLIARSSSGRSYFGEYATLVRTTSKHFVFITESGSQVKTSKDNLHQVVGKFSDYFISPNVEGRDEDPNFHKDKVHYWNSTKCVMEYK